MTQNVPIDPYFDPLDDVDPEIRPIMLWLKDIGDHAAKGNVISAIQRADAALFSYPTEPIFYLRRADLIVQDEQLSRTQLGLNLFAESSKMVTTLDKLSDDEPTFKMIGEREKKYFSYLMNFYEKANWFRLLEQTKEVAAAYYPDTRNFGVHKITRPTPITFYLPPSIKR